MDKLTDHELQILREINGDLPASSWGAWVGACYESLSEGGYITREGITEKGKQYLATASLASASAGDGELEPRCRDDKLLPALKECILTLGAAGEFHDTGVIASALERIQFDAARIRALAGEVAELRKGRRDEELKEDARLGAALARAESAESQLSALRAENERLRKALEPFAKAASDYERQGEFFSDNIELVLRVSVFAAPEYHNSTAVQVGDLRRARSELEAGHE